MKCVAFYKHLLPYPSQQSYRVGTAIIPILQIRKLRLQKPQQLAQLHTEQSLHPDSTRKLPQSLSNQLNLFAGLQLIVRPGVPPGYD